MSILDSASDFISDSLPDAVANAADTVANVVAPTANLVRKVVSDPKEAYKTAVKVKDTIVDTADLLSYAPRMIKEEITGEASKKRETKRQYLNNRKLFDKANTYLSAGESPTTIVNSIAKARPHLVKTITTNRNAKVDDMDILNQIVDSEDRHTDIKLDTIKYNLPNTGSHKLDDYFIGTKKALAGVARTGQDVGRALGFINKRDYDLYDEESQNHITALDNALHDKDFISMGTLGNVASSISTGGVAMKGLQALSGASRVGLVTGLVKANPIATSVGTGAIGGYVDNRSTADSTVGGSLISGAVSGGLGYVVPKGVEKVLKSINTSDQEKVFNRLLKDAPTLKESIPKIMEDFYNSGAKTSGDETIDKILALAYHMHSNEEMKNAYKLMSNHSTDKEMEGVINAFMQSKVNREQLLTGLVDYKVNNSMSSNLYGVETSIINTAEDIQKSTQIASKNYDGLLDNLDDVVIGTNDKAKQIRIDTENATKRKSSIIDTRLTLNDKVRELLDYQKTKGTIDMAFNDRAVNKKLMLDEIQLLRNDLEKKIIDDTNYKHININDLKIKFDGTEETLFPNLVESISTPLSQLKEVNTKEILTTKDLISAIGNINSIQRNKSAGNFSAKFNLSQIKANMESKLKQNMTVAEYDMYKTVQKDWATLAKIRDTKLFTGLKDVLTDINNNKNNLTYTSNLLDKYIDDIPTLIKSVNSDNKMASNVFDSLSSVIGTDKAKVFEKAVVQNAFNTMLNKTPSRISSEQLQKLLTSSTMNSEEVRALKGLNETMLRTFGGDMPKYALSHENIFSSGDRKTGLDTVIKAIILTHGVRWATKIFSPATRHSNRMSKILSNPIQMKNATDYLNNLPQARKEGIQKLINEDIEIAVREAERNAEQ